MVFRGSHDPLKSFQYRQQSIVSARDDVSTPTEGHNGCGKRASRLFQPTCTSVQEHDHKQMGTQSCPSEYARSLPTESPRLRERSKTLASSQKAPFARAECEGTPLDAIHEHCAPDTPGNLHDAIRARSDTHCRRGHAQLCDIGRPPCWLPSTRCAVLAAAGWPLPFVGSVDL